MTNVPKFGFGVSGPLAWGFRYEVLTRRLLDQALEAGVRRFDTAGFYGGGLGGPGVGETRLGRALSAWGEPVFVSTKVGKAPVHGGYHGRDFSPTALRRDVEASLERLQLSCVDVVYLHGPMPVELAPGLDALRDLKEEGLLRRVGVCTEGAFVLPAIEAGAEAIMAPFNFLNDIHGPAFAKARAGGVHVSAVAPLAQSLYTPQFMRMRTPADAWRIARGVFKYRDEYKTAQSLAQDFEALQGWRPPEAALAYVLPDERIDCAIATTTKPDHLASLLSAMGRSLTAEERSAMDAMRTRYQTALYHKRRR